MSQTRTPPEHIEINMSAPVFIFDSTEKDILHQKQTFDNGTVTPFIDSYKSSPKRSEKA